MPNRDRTINYVEFTVPDVAAARQFYGEVFGWKFTDYGPDYTSFAAAEAGTDGGFTRGKPSGGGGTLIVLYAGDLEGTQQRVEAAGGRIVKPIFSFPGGRRFHFTNPGGNELAVWSE